MPNCTPSLIASQSRNPRRRTATPVVSLNRARPNMGHTWTPNCPTYFLPIPMNSRMSRVMILHVACSRILRQFRAPTQNDRRTESERFVPLARKAKQAIRGWSMQPDAVQRENKPLECRVILVGALSPSRMLKESTGAVEIKHVRFHE